MAISYRNRNEGQFYQDGKKKKPNWEYRFYISSFDGKRRRIEKCGFERKADAVEAAMKEYNEYLTGTHVQEDKNLSFVSVLLEWYHRQEPKYSEATKLNVTSRINHIIIPAFKNYSIQAITFRILQRFMDDLADKGMTTQEVRNVRAPLSNTFVYAKKMGYISTNPIKEVEMPTCTVKQKKRRAYSKQEVDSVLSYVKENYNYYLPFLLGYRCGLRAGEIFGLTWDNVDFKKKTIYIEKQRHRTSVKNKSVFSDPKYNSKREIYVDSKTLSYLREEKIRQETNRLKMGSSYIRAFVTDEKEYNLRGIGKEIHLVCVTEKGRPMNYNYCAIIAAGIKKDLGLKDFCFHGLRHTHASELSENGVNVKEIQERLGHTSFQLTESIYIHKTKKMQEDSIRIMEEMYK